MLQKTRKTGRGIYVIFVKTAAQKIRKQQKLKGQKLCFQGIRRE
jgi:predicted RNA-binding protein YlxR (DUF448 family)